MSLRRQAPVAGITAAGVMLAALAAGALGATRPLPLGHVGAAVADGPPVATCLSAHLAA